MLGSEEHGAERTGMTACRQYDRLEAEHGRDDTNRFDNRWVRVQRPAAVDDARDAGGASVGCRKQGDVLGDQTHGGGRQVLLARGWAELARSFGIDAACEAPERRGRGLSSKGDLALLVNIGDEQVDAAALTGRGQSDELVMALALREGDAKAEGRPTAECGPADAFHFVALDPQSGGPGSDRNEQVGGVGALTRNLQNFVGASTPRVELDGVARRAPQGGEELARPASRDPDPLGFQLAQDTENPVAGRGQPGRKMALAAVGLDADLHERRTGVDADRRDGAGRNRPTERLIELAEGHERAHALQCLILRRVHRLPRSLRQGMSPTRDESPDFSGFTFRFNQLDSPAGT